MSRNKKTNSMLGIQITIRLRLNRIGTYQTHERLILNGFRSRIEFYICNVLYIRRQYIFIDIYVCCLDNCSIYFVK